MAGDWIKITTNLATKPEVFGIAKVVRQNRYEVVGRLVAVWSWADQSTTDGELSSVSAEDIDEIAGTPGFAAAMRSVGWLSGRDGELQLPNFERHNGTSAKARALEQEAKRLRRLSDKLSDNLSDTCPTKPAVIVRPEKRREEKRRDTSPNGDVNTPLPPLLDVPRFIELIALWKSYKAERHEPYKPTGWKAMLSRAANLAHQHGVDVVCVAIETAMTNNWAGWDQESSFRSKQNGTRNREPGAGQRYIPGTELGPV